MCSKLELKVTKNFRGKSEIPPKSHPGFKNKLLILQTLDNKSYAKKYELNEKVIYPHSFRHRFAKNFLEKFNDISLLADLMGHESIETTRIYLRRTSAEQQDIVDRVITW